jgi:hypothetical protein
MAAPTLLLAFAHSPTRDNYNEFSAEISGNLERFLEGEQSAETTVRKIE